MTGKWAFIGIALAAGVGCAQPEPDRELIEQKRVQIEGQDLDKQLDQLEARLLEGRALVAQSQMLKERHGQVAEVACQSLQGHWDGISRFLDNQADKASKKRHASLAQAEASGGSD